MSLAEFIEVISSAYLIKLREHYREIGKGAYGRILSLSIIIYTVVLSALTSLKFYCFRSLAFDMGIFIQLLWQSNHGNPLYTQPRWGPEHPKNFFGVHFAPFVYPLTWLYGLVESPYLLLVLQSVALELWATGEYGVYANVDGFIILMRGHESPAWYRAPLSFVLDPATARNHFISFEDRIPETQFYVPGWVEIEGGSLRLEPRFRGPIWWGPYVTVPPGNYTVMVMLEGLGAVLPCHPFMIRP